MKFEIIHNEISLILTLTEENNFIPSDRFTKLSPQTMIALKKKEISSFGLLIEAQFKDQNAKFYYSNVLLSTNQEEILEELEEYIINEEILENIEEYWRNFFDLSPYPKWAK